MVGTVGAGGVWGRRTPQVPGGDSPVTWALLSLGERVLAPPGAAVSAACSGAGREPSKQTGTGTGKQVGAGEMPGSLVGGHHPLQVGVFLLPSPARRDRQEHWWGSGNPGRFWCRAWLRGRDGEGGSRAELPNASPAAGREGIPNAPSPSREPARLRVPMVLSHDRPHHPGLLPGGASGIAFRCRGRGTRTPRLGPPPQGIWLVAPWAALLCPPTMPYPILMP